MHKKRFALECGIAAVLFVGIVWVYGARPSADPGELRTPRPQPGDTITPRLQPANAWHAGKTGYLLVKLRVSGADGMDNDYLHLEETVPGAMLQAGVTFYSGEGEAVQERSELPFAPDC
jgi:hypothetical protein